MNEENTKVLLIEDNPGDVRLIKEVLAEARNTTIHLDWADRLSAGLGHLTEKKIDLILLDLSLPDSQGLDTLHKVRTQAPEMPIIVLTGLNDESLAVEAVQIGAQDYLMKGEINKNLLVRAILYAVERQRLLTELQTRSLIDDLTGLRNRRGFLTMAEQQLKTAAREKRGAFLLFAGLDGVKRIKDNLGHHKGDLALIEMADILTGAFRAADIVARIGGDKFSVFGLKNSNFKSEHIVNRLQERLEMRNRQGHHDYSLSASTGIAHYDPFCPCSLEELMAKAGRALDEQKRGKQKPLG